MLDYKDIITKHYALGMSGMSIQDVLVMSVGLKKVLRKGRATSMPFPISDVWILYDFRKKSNT